MANFKNNGPGGCCCGGGGGGGSVSIAGCNCTSSPETLTMTSADTTCNFGMFQNCTITYGPTPSAFLPTGIGANSYLSTTSFPDEVAGGAEFYYYLSCQYAQWTLSRVYLTSPYGSPYRDGILYTWSTGSYNTCIPFILYKGTAFSGSDASCCVRIFDPSISSPSACSH